MTIDSQIKEVWFIRHAESMGNAGFATSDPATIPLTKLGHQQAKLLATYITLQPDLIVTSPYMRTFQTATPTIQYCHQAKQSEWQIQEFTYLAPARCVNTTANERKVMVDDFWVRSDPDYVDGQGAESFSKLICRIQSMQQKLHRLDAGSKVLVFTHGVFINAFRWSLANSSAPITQLYMSNFHDFHLTWSVPNCGILKCKFDSQNRAWLQPKIDDFITKNLSE